MDIRVGKGIKHLTVLLNNDDDDDDDDFAQDTNCDDEAKFSLQQ